MNEELKYCKFCDKEKPIKEFCKSGGAIKNICRECQNKKHKNIYREAKILTELEEWVKSEYERYYNDKENLVFSNVEVIDFSRVLDKIQELKEKYK